MTKVGEHITLDIVGTTKEYSPEFYEKLVYKIAKLAKVTVLEISKYKFEPQGFTLVALLAESHMSFHTFPENGIISFDFFTCAKVSPTVAIDVIKNDIELCLRVLKKDGVLIFDDYESKDVQDKKYTVGSVVDEFLKENKDYYSYLVEFRGHIFHKEKKELRAGTMILSPFKLTS